MTGRFWFICIAATILAAFFLRSPVAANGFPCFPDDAIEVVQPRTDVRGRGLNADQTLVRLSVNTQGHFVITVKIPETPVFCVISMGDTWQWVKQTPGQVAWTER